MNASSPVDPRHIVHVHVHVKLEHIPEFIQATRINADNSRREPGVLQFDLLQHHDDPGRFVLVEVYRDAQAPIDHKATPHYAAWRDAVAPWMASPRAGIKMRDLG